MREDDVEFTEFVSACSPALLRSAYYLTGDRHLAEDLLQTTLTKTYLQWKRIQSQGAVNAYAHRIMVNTAIAWWRRRSWRAEQPRDDVPDRGVAAGTDEVDERDRVIEAVRRLPARQRAVVALRFLEDKSEAETARLLGCSPGTVKSHSSRALKQLRLSLNDISVPLEYTESR